MARSHHSAAEPILCAPELGWAVRAFRRIVGFACIRQRAGIHKRVARVLVAALAILVTAGAASSCSPRSSDMADTTAASDPFRWLESASSQEQLWLNGRVRLSDGILNRWADAQLNRRVRALSRVTPVRYDLQVAGGVWVYKVLDPVENYPILARRFGEGSQEARIDREPPESFVGSFYLSPDGRTVAYSSVKKGTDFEYNLKVVNVTIGKPVEDLGGKIRNLAWDRNSRGFLYTARGATVWHHHLGAPQALDQPVFAGRGDLIPVAIIQSHSGAHTVVVEKVQPSADALVFERFGSGPFKMLAGFHQKVKDVSFIGEVLMFRSWLRHPTYDFFKGRSDGHMSQQPFIKSPRTNDVLLSAISSGGDVLIHSRDPWGESHLDLYSNRGKHLGRINLPSHSSVYRLTPESDMGDAIVDFDTYREPSRWARYSVVLKRISQLGIKSTPPAAYSKVVIRNVSVRSLDGNVYIPLTIVTLSGRRIGASSPTVLTAYGAHGDIEGPRFLGTWLAWLEKGGVWALAHVRGGGEKGEAWYRSALMNEKVRSADDLAVCARWLSSHGYGAAAHLGLVGNSTGAFLVGLSITRNPRLYGAAVAESGLYDLLRSGRGEEPFANPELGDASKPQDKAWLKTESPYYALSRGERYPAVFMSYGSNDQIVSPMNTRKMIARLDDVDPMEPRVIRVRLREGHGANISYADRVLQKIEEFTFLERVLK